SIKLSNKLTEAGIIIKALLTGIDSIFYVKNNELLYLTANVAFLKNISLKPSFTVFGKTDEDFFSKKEANDNSYKDEQVLITKKQSVEEGFIPGSKKKKWGIITRIPIFDLNDNVMGIITNVMDITNRKKSEYYNELLRTCLENMPNTAVSIYNLKAANMVYANEMATKLSGYSLDEICDKKSDLALNVLCSPEEKAKSQEYRKSGIWPKDRELQIKCKDGTVKWILETNSQVTDFMNSEYMVGIATDITEEKNQSKQNSAFSNLFDYANIGIKLRNDTTGEIFFINKHFGSIFGHPNEKFMKKDKFRIENCVHSEDKERESEYYKSNRYPKVRDYRIIRADGELRYIREVSFQADYAEEKYSGCICRDITESDASGIINPYKTAKILKDENVDISIISRACGLSEEIIKGI
ncbi:MAG: PAS domain S-box protein, partial [bacterium]|nr:PAS domain S-box protein [bacterium]